jgi:hypothetical protein
MAPALEPLRGLPNKGPITQIFKTPVKMGNSPIAAIIVPLGPPVIKRPEAIIALPATMRRIRPVGEAIKRINAFIVYLQEWKKSEV